MKVRDIISVRTDGWFLKQTRGVIGNYKHPMKPGRVTLPGIRMTIFPRHFE